MLIDKFSKYDNNGKDQKLWSWSPQLPGYVIIIFFLSKTKSFYIFLKSYDSSSHVVLHSILLLQEYFEVWFPVYENICSEL